jgi:RNA 2',3'-cyclic 3'-phosphodiesterase
MEKIRAFFALNLDNSVKDKISVIQKELQKKLHSHAVKWENPEKFHLTLSFLGDVPKPDIKEFIEDLSNLRLDFNQIKYNSAGIGFFPNASKPNVIYLGLTEEGSNAEKLVNEINKETLTKGIIPDKKYIPHITLGRFRRENTGRLNADFKIKFEWFEVVLKSFYLMKSTMDSKGSTYHVVKEFNFAK